MRILMIEDDKMLGDATRQGLVKEGYAVDWVQDKKDASIALSVQRYDLVVLDIGLPDGSGLDMLSAMRQKSNKTPVLILTANDTVRDRVRGLDTGADDYLIKPFDIEELCARIRSLHRRSLGEPSPLITYKDIILNPASYHVTKDGKEIEIGPKEFVILQTLIGKAGRVISKTVLEETLYGWDDEFSSNTIEVHIHRIRKKLGNDFIKNIRGVGYIVEKTV